MRGGAWLLLAALLLAADTSAQALNEQCTLPYLNLTSATRSNLYSNAKVQVCDDGRVLAGAAANQDWAGIGWYRFVDAAGAKMASTAPDTGACGTGLQGWLSESHPSGSSTRTKKIISTTRRETE